MELDHRFTVPAPIDEAWQVLLDVPRVAPCMPGATLDEFDGKTFTGSVKVKLGPISLLYRGKGSFVETDEAAHRMVMEASGKESRGSGTAAATVTATMAADGDATQVDVTTELKITGRPAQFGRGMINDVGGKLLGQFADCLATTLGQPSAEEAAPADAATEASTTDSAGTADESSPDDVAAEQARVEVEPIDLLEITGAQAAMRRYAPAAVIGALLALLVWFVVRRRR